ncbi:hypothetical protein GCM10023238_34540 [Streptomyces heliomycini]
MTAVAEATANPRTEIRLTRFPSSIARSGDPRGRNRAPGTGLPNYGSREARARWATPARERARGDSGGIRRRYGVETVVLYLPHRLKGVGGTPKGYRCVVCGA